MASREFKMYRLVYAVLLTMGWLALLSFNASDLDLLSGGLEHSGATANLLGTLGARFAWSLLITLGLASYLLLGIASLCCLRRIFFRGSIRAISWEYYLAIPLFGLGCSLMMGIFPRILSEATAALNISTLPGGVIGNLFCAPGTGWIYSMLSATGSAIASLLVILLSAAVIWNCDWRETTGKLFDRLNAKLKENAEKQLHNNEAAVAGSAAYPAAGEVNSAIQPDMPSAESGVGFRGRRGEASYAAARAVQEAVNAQHPAAPPQRPQFQPSAPPPPPPPRQQILPITQNVAYSKPAEPTVSVLPRQPEPVQSSFSDEGYYQLPTSQFFAPPKDTGNYSSADEIQVNIDRIQNTLDTFQIDASVINAIPGPQITLYEIALGQGVLVSRISSIKNNLAMELRTQIRLLLPIPGKNTVGVEVPNTHCITVTARELFDSDAWVNSKAHIPVMLGKNIKNETVLIDLEKAPHLLVAGSTGSGKSVCMNLMIQSLLMHFGPDELKLIMFDPKVLEFQAYANLPHLIAPIINEPEKMGLVLRWAINEMERRYIQLADANVRKMSEFNSRPISDVPKYDRNGEVIPNRLPHIVIIIDELGDIMQRNAKEVDNALSRLAAKSRAAGIHMIIATQRPDSKIISGTIKVNFPWRIALKVTDGINSRVIFDQTGAETLLGNGDMLFRGSGDVERIQGGWVTNREIDDVVAYCCNQRGQVFDSGLNMALLAQDPDDIDCGSRGGNSAPGNDGGGVSEPADGGDRISQALEIIRTSKKASISHLQRRLGIGYNKAADLVDELESLGYLGPQPQSGPREIYWDNFPVSDFPTFNDDDDAETSAASTGDNSDGDVPPFA